MSRTSLRQMYAILDFLEKHPALARGTMRDIEGRDNARQLWHKLANIINNMSGARKTSKGWAKFWSDKKCTVKKNASFKTDAYNVTSDIDKRILALCLGDKTVTKKTRVKKEKNFERNNHDDEGALNGDLQEENNANFTMEERSVEFEEQPMLDMEERQMVLMEKLVQAMNQQSSALAQLAQASETQALAMERLADASQIQAKAVERLANSFENIGSATHNIRDAVVDIDHTMKRFYNTAPT